MNRPGYLGCIAAILLLTGCAVGPRAPAGEPCIAETYTVSDDHYGARRGSCRVLRGDHVRIDILPEDEPPINDSPWYSFRVTPSAETEAQITLRYKGGHHRYWPKLSYDGLNWTALDDTQVSWSNSGKKAEIQLELDGRPVYVSAQELITPNFYDIWLDNVAAETEAEVDVLGGSLRGLPIQWFNANTNAPEVLLIIGRQHPPEVSGAFAYVAFADTLLSDSELAIEFRKRFRIIGIPLMNPDGVNGGNWRHNLGGVDLNRDWGPFTQPETQHVEALLDKLDANQQKLRMFIDFHSTKRNLFYTQSAESPTKPPNFVPAWLGNSAARLENYEFTNEDRPVSEQANSKNYMYKRYGIPTVTYEVGDETDRAATQAAAEVFAEELMKLMLSTDY